MSMQAKRVLTVAIGLLMAGLTTWKGPSVAGAVAGVITAICILVGTLHVLPAKYEPTIQIVEDAVEKKAPTVPPLPLLVFALLLLLVAGCPSSTVPNAEYAGQLKACDDTSSTRAEDDACKQRVRDAWNEAGAPPAAVLDGGAE